MGLRFQCNETRCQASTNNVVACQQDAGIVCSKSSFLGPYYILPFYYHDRKRKAFDTCMHACAVLTEGGEVEVKVEF